MGKSHTLDELRMQAHAGRPTKHPSKVGRIQNGGGAVELDPHIRELATNRHFGKDAGMRAFLLLLVALFASCQKAQAPVTQQTLHVNIVVDPSTIDPRRARDLNSITVCRMLFEGLTRIGSDNKPELALAERVQVSDDGLRYTFTLRASQWSNGEPVTSNDVVASWKQVLDPQFGTDIAHHLYLIKNGQRVKAGELSASELGLHAPDSQTLIVDLEQPTPYFLEACAMSAYFFVPKSAGTAELGVGTLVGNGPFLLASWVHNDALRVTKNHRYWEADRVHLDEIELSMLSADTEIRLFEEGKLDWAGSPLSTLPVDALGYLKQEKLLRTSPFSGTYFLRANVAPMVGGKKNPLSSKAFRQALALTIDRVGITEHLLQAGQAPATTLVPPGFLGGDHIAAVSQTPKALLEEALKELGVTREQLEPIVVNFSTSLSYNLPIVQAIQKQWEEALGIRVELQQLESKVHFQKVKQKDYQLATGSWIADFNQPINFLEVFKHKETSTNNTNWGHPLYADLLTRSQVSRNAEERRETLRSAEALFMQEMPVIPIFHHSMAYLQNPELEGVILSPMGQIDFRWAHKR